MKEKKKKISFIPGPSTLYPTVDKHISEALISGVVEQSHRSEYFKRMYLSTVTALRMLLNLPDDFHIVFTSSATEVWEHSLNNFVKSNSLHLVNGAFGERFYQFARLKNIHAQKISSKHPNISVRASDVMKDINSPELVSVTLNESSTGIFFPLEEIANLRKIFPDALIGIDSVSDTPFTPLDYKNIDFFYFSVQKCFGLPPGLGVWVVNNRCISRAKSLDKKNHFIGTYRQLPLMVEKSNACQTIETPNILNIYLLGKIANDMLDKGLEVIRDEIIQKYKLINSYVIQSNADVKFFVKKDKERSNTVIVLETKHAKDICTYMEQKGYLIASGYGQYKDKHIRIGNFASQTMENVKIVVNLLSDCNNKIQ